MNHTLLIFSVIGLILLGLVGYFLRGALFSVSTIAAEHAKIYAVAYVKGGALILIAMFTAFKEEFAAITNGMADHFAWWDWAVLFMTPLMAGLAVLVAFLDRSVQRGSEEAANVKAAASGTTPPFPAAPGATPPAVTPSV